jgi:hypothetical protein
MTTDAFKDIEKLENDLWEAADNLRANSKLTSSDYFMPVLGVIFLRHAANRFDDAARQIAEDQASGKMPKRKLVPQNAGRATIDADQPEEAVVVAAEAALVAAADPKFPLMRNANCYVRPVVDRPSWGRACGSRPVPTIAMLVPYDEAAFRWTLDRWVEFEGRAMCSASSPTTLRSACWRIRCPADGRLLDKPGLDEESGLYLHLGGELGITPEQIAQPIPVPDDPVEARRVAGEFLRELLADYDDYRFEAEIDRATALAAGTSILLRKDLDIAPCYLLVGPERGTGKTTLAAIDAVIATGHDIAAAILEKDPEKAKQTLFSAFVSSPAAVLFDNLPADSAYSSAVLAAALTKGEIEARGYYTQTNVKASTNVQLYFTGNAVVLDEDLQARTLEVRFSPDRPVIWSHSDWLAHARAIRERVRSQLQFINRAFIRHGGGAHAVPRWRVGALVISIPADSVR